MNALRNHRRHSRRAVAVAAVASLLFLGSAPAAQAEAANPTLKINYKAVGTTHIGGQVDTTMPLGPSTLSTTTDLVTTNIVDGALAVPSQTVSFDVFGIPARAKVTMTQKGPLTGTLTPTAVSGRLLLSSNLAYDIKLSHVEARVFGIWWPLAVGNNCHTINPVNINASTPDGEYFRVLSGGRVTGTYTIGNFTGCTPLNFFDIPGFFPWFGSIPINTLVPGSNNTLDLQLSDPLYGG